MKLFNWLNKKEVPVTPKTKHSDAELKIIQFLRDKAVEDITQFQVRYAPRAYVFVHNDGTFVITPHSVIVTDCASIPNTDYLFDFIFSCAEAH